MGRVWWPDRISLAQNFRMDFVIFAGTKDNNGADGYAFVFQNDTDGTDSSWILWRTLWVGT